MRLCYHAERGNKNGSRSNALRWNEHNSTLFPLILNPDSAGVAAYLVVEVDNDKPVYVISVVAEMLSTTQQTLRIYEKEKLVVPKRTQKNTRLYSMRDVEELRRILQLHQELGVNLAGIEVILNMRRKMEKMQEDVYKFVEIIKEKFNITAPFEFTDTLKGTELIPISNVNKDMVKIKTR